MLGGALLLSVLTPVYANAGAAARDGLAHYVRARLAEGQGDALAAAAQYRAALALDPDNADIQRRAYRQALIAGDMGLALRLGVSAPANAGMPRDALLLLAIDAFGRKDRPALERLADRIEETEQLAFLAPFVRSWARVGTPDYDPPVIDLRREFSAYGLRHVDEQSILQAFASGNDVRARAQLKATQSSGAVFSEQFRVLAALRLARTGERQAALDLLDADDPALAELRDRIAAGKSVPAPSITPLTGIALLIDRLATDLAPAADAPTILSLRRLASYADPRSDAVRAHLAVALLGANQNAAALREARAIPRGSPVWLEAQTAAVAALANLGQMDDALKAGRALVRETGSDARSWRVYAALLGQSGDAAGAARAYARAIALPGNGQDARLALLYAHALQESGDWPQARRELDRAVKISPNNPIILNHLGYSLAERNEELPLAIELLERANKVKPGDPAYMDSLGWAYFHAGRIDEAITLLDQAVRGLPAQPDVNEHLGDALWAKGRRYEARYAWRAATAYADKDTKARLLRKIDGLPSQ